MSKYRTVFIMRNCAFIIAAGLAILLVTWIAVPLFLSDVHKIALAMLFMTLTGVSISLCAVAIAILVKLFFVDDLRYF